MVVVIYAIVLVALLVVYYFCKKRTASKVFIQCVEAGPTSEVDAEELKRRSYYDKDIVIRGMQGGGVLSSARYKRILVKGTCMTPRNISDGDLLVAETYFPNTDFYKELMNGDIVWFKIEDTGMDKIRIFDGWIRDEMKTYYYKGDKKHPSSINHNPSQICGVVRYKINTSIIITLLNSCNSKRLYH